ncbi:MAG TPA: TasA family protein, partial [Clostridia bacterium]|nr:TasA family protein [Clostridia bacterium]
MKKRIIMSVMAIAICTVLLFGATTAYFSDKETSNGNTFTAGTLDLLIDGGNDNVVGYNVTNMYPDNEPAKAYILKNNGSLGGYLNITSATKTSMENDLIEPEREAGDTTEGTGELDQFLRIQLYFDLDNSGW